MFKLRDIVVGPPAAPGMTLLRGLTLQLASGDWQSLVGPSGCGKSTLLRAVAGLIDPQSGEVLLDGQTPAQIGWPVFRRKVCYVAQRPALLDLTVRQTLERVFAFRAAGKPYDSNHAEALLEEVQLGVHRLDQPARSLSEGQQQRLALIRALLVKPQILLLDEPTSALDEENTALIEQLLRRHQRDTGLSGLLVTHDRAQAKRLTGHTVDLQPLLVAQEAAA